MMNENTSGRVSLVGKLIRVLGVTALAVAALFAGGMAFGATSAHAQSPTPPTPTVEVPTATPEPGAMIFVGDIEVVTADVCGGGSITLTLTPGDPGDGISTVSVAGFFVNGTEANESFMFDPAVTIAGDGSFSDSAPLPPPLDAILASIAGTFDFTTDPATVSGTLTIGLVADPGGTPLCEADFTGEALAAGAPTPTVPPPAPTVAAAVPTALPVTGASVTPGTGGDGVLWAVVAGIAAVLALGAAGTATVRLRSGK